MWRRYTWIKRYTSYSLEEIRAMPAEVLNIVCDEIAKILDRESGRE